MPVGMNSVTGVIQGYQAPTKGVYWIGNDGNVWVKGSEGVNSAGAYDANSDNYWYGQGFNKIADPVNGPTSTNRVSSSSTGSGGTGSGGSGGGSSYDVSLYDQSIRNLLGSQSVLDQQQNIGLQNVAGDYNNNLQRLINNKNQTTQQYQQSQDTTKLDNQKARSNVDFETGQRANALQRLLGSKGAGSSSASRFAAPYAAALEGTQQLNQVGDAFQKNMGALDANYNTYTNEWNQKKDDLDAQKVNQENAVKQDVMSKRQTLLQSLAQLQAQRASALGGNPVAASQGSFDQANALSGQIAGLGQQYYGKVNVADPTYNAPDLAKYNYDARGQIGQSQGAQGQSISPYLSLLINGKDKKQQNQV